MSDYKEVTDSLEVPSHAGVEGFIAAMRQILRQPRLTQVTIDGSGKVTYTRWVREQEPRKTIEVDFDSVSPSALVRNLEVQELDLFDHMGNASTCISAMFFAAELEQMCPVAFVTGANSVFGEWHLRTTGVRIGSKTAYGIPVYKDRFIPDDALLLVTAYSRGAALIDSQKSYKIAMPGREKLITRAVEVEISPRVEQLSMDSPLVLAVPPTQDEVKVVP